MKIGFVSIHMGKTTKVVHYAIQSYKKFTPILKISCLTCNLGVTKYFCGEHYASFFGRLPKKMSLSNIDYL